MIGYVFRKFGIPKAPLLFGLILRHTLEQSFRQAPTISDGDPIAFVRSPIAAGLLGCRSIRTVDQDRRTHVNPVAGTIRKRAGGWPLTEAGIVVIPWPSLTATRPRAHRFRLDCGRREQTCNAVGNKYNSAPAVGPQTGPCVVA